MQKKRGGISLVGRLREFWIGRADLAPVALFRIVYGVELFNWFWQLFPNIAAFFTDEGFMPRTLLVTMFPDRFSLITGMGTWWQIAIFWSACLVVAVMLTIGWHTRTACVLAFVGVASFEWRNPLLLDGSDIVFRLIPFWLALTNCGDLYSVDAAMRKARGEILGGSGPSLPVRVLELQIGWIYLMTGLEKMAGTLWTNGTATYYALQLEHTFGRSWAYPLFPVIMLSTLILFVPADWVRTFVDAIQVRIGPRFTPRLAAATAGATRELRRVPVMPVRSARLTDVRAARVAGAAILLAVTAVAFSSAFPSWAAAYRPQGDLARVLVFSSLDQRWDMFSPDPAQADGWMLAPATLADGGSYDLLTGGPVSTAPRWSDPLYTRWVKVFERIANSGYTDYRLEFGRSFCRLRNFHLQPGQSPLDTFALNYVERTIHAPGEPPTLQEFHIWSHQC